jgi:hypothetical protein
MFVNFRLSGGRWNVAFPLDAAAEEIKEKATGGLKRRIHNRMRSVNKKVIAIALAGRLKAGG